MSRFLICLIVFALILTVRNTAAQAPGTTYYVSASAGNDDWPATEAQPWRTLAKVSSITFQPGDQILLQRGNVWEGEELVLSGNGSFMDDSWIRLGAYGDGDRPRITNPPFDMTPGLVDWSAVNDAYPGTNREYMTIAVRVDGSGWQIRDLEIAQAEMGIYGPGGITGLWIENLYIHDIQGLLMPIYPDFEILCATACPIWSPYPQPAWGSAIEVHGDYVTIRDVVVEDATGGIAGYGSVRVIENVFLNRVVVSTGISYGHAAIIRYATILNAEWPEGVWFGADPVMSLQDTNFTLERSEIAYTDNHDLTSDASPIDFDMETVNGLVRDNFFHDNVGSALEFNLAGENRRITVENNVMYNNGLKGEGYLGAAFSADGCAYPGTSYTIQGNVIYLAFPGQPLNYYFNFPPYAINDFSLAEQCGQYTVVGNTVYEAGEYALPLPIPAPPPIAQVNIAPAAAVEVSSGGETASLTQDNSLDTEWVSAEAQPWIVYAWDSPQTIDRIRLFDRPDLENWAVSGVLTFSDGSPINVTGGILNNGAMREVIFDSPRTVTWAQFTVTRNVPESPGTNVGLTELQVYLADAAPPPAPLPSSGDFMLDFSDRPESPTLLVGLYPDNVNGIDWKAADWTTGTDAASGNRYLYVDFPRNVSGNPAVASRMFILPRGKILKSISVACPTSATVAFGMADQPALTINCTGELTHYDTGWASPLGSNIVGVWIDLNNTPTFSLNDVWVDDLVYGD